jgi:hypothetical protein
VSFVVANSGFSARPGGLWMHTEIDDPGGWRQGPGRSGLQSVTLRYAPRGGNIASIWRKYAAATHESRPTMTDTIDALIFDLLEYVACKERRYSEVMEVWRTSCPRLPVWEEANERRLIARVRANGQTVVQITAAGAALLEERR